MPLGLVGFDKRALGGAPCLVGIDEAGRGCLAGPVVAVAVRCEGAFYSSSWCRRNSRGVDDSKRLTPEKRAAIVNRFAPACGKDGIRLGIGLATIEEIERHNIYHATTLAMRRALEKVLPFVDAPLWYEAEADGANSGAVILIDGRSIRNFPLPHRGIVKGDQRSLAMALAGIHAKEHRDALMGELDRKYPEYGFGSHKGYGTAHHMKALRRYGPTVHHRPSFLGKVLSGRDPAIDSRQDSLL